MTDMTALQSRSEDASTGEDFSASVMSIEIGPAHPAMPVSYTHLTLPTILLV